MIVCPILNILNINITFFISWKPNVVFVHLACHMWSTNLFDVDLNRRKQAELMSETEVIICRTRMVRALFPPPPFCKKKQYGEGEMSQAVVFVYFIIYIFYTYSFSSGSLLIMINHCSVLLLLAYI